MNRAWVGSRDLGPSRFLPLAILFWPTFVSVFMCSSVTSAQALPKNATFTRQELQQLTAKQTPHVQRAQLWKKFARLTPSTNSDVDLLYACLDSADAKLQSAARAKLCAVHEQALVERSRSYINAADLKKAKVAIRVVLRANDVEAIPLLREFAANPKARKLEYFTKHALAQLGDPKLLDQLLDEDRQPEDPTLADYNKQLLKAYGSKVLNRLLTHVKAGRLKTRSFVNYVRDIRDKDAVPELVQLYRETKHDDLRDAILHSFCCINSRQCQPILRSALEDQALMRKLPSETEIMIIAAIWGYDNTEIKRFREKVLTLLGKGSPVQKRMAAQLTGAFAIDKHFEANAAVALTKLLPTEYGRIAAKSLQKLTGQQFQYAKPRNESAGWGERRLKGQSTAEDLGLTEESVKGFEERERAVLERIRKKLDRDKSLSDEERQRIWKKYQADILRSIEYQKNLLRQNYRPPREIGIPTDKAEEWIRKYYSLGQEAE